MGIRQSKGEIVTLLDGDLVGLTENIIQSLVDPLVSNSYDVIIGYPSKMIVKLFKPISGQRAYYRQDLLPLLDKLEKKGYGIDLFLNFSFRKRRVKLLVLSGFYHVVKHNKQPFRMACKSYYAEIKEIVA